MYDILTCLNRLHPVSPELKNYLLAAMRSKKISKYQYLLKEGETSSAIWYLEKGLVRCFYNHDDKEVTMWFINEGHAVVALESLFEQKPFSYYLQALENSRVWGLDYSDLQYILSNYSEATVMRVKITEWYMNLLNMRLRCTSMQSPKEKYNYFLKHFSYLSGRVILEIMASYMDISKRTLIRLMQE